MRATQAPDKWELVLDAISDGDYELANKLAVKYKFASKVYKNKSVDDVRHRPLKGDYVAMDPDGNVYCHELASVLSRYLGLSNSYVSMALPRLEKHDGYSQSGKLKGWKIWKE